MIKNINQESKELLLKILLNLKTEEQAREFLNDLFSSAEVSDLARRAMAAKLLYSEKTYQQIYHLLGMGANTITKVHFKTRGNKVLKEIINELR